ncbi:GNAT family N-acetyltransferase [Planomonospora corallina]|uniref:GNAT family N-acetyltransferase n=1 Tax=Planomonospora corallina TaxID=1806052 RepID=A0ABV8IDH8_9ACTN
MPVEIHPAVAQRWDDLRTVLCPTENRQTCWCMAWRLTTADYNRRTAEERGAVMRGLVDGDPPPGLLAYVDGEVAGWCNVGPRADMARLTGSRTIPPVDGIPVWSVVCFVVRASHRRRGVAEALLLGAVDHARAHGAPAIEGYPVDPEGGRINPSLAYVGTMGMFERAGFRRLLKTEAKSDRRHRWVVRLDLR